MLFAMILLIYVPCYFGNEIITKSGKLTTKLYKSNWIDMDLRQQKYIVIVMERFKRSTFLLVGWLFILGLDTFTSVIAWKNLDFYSITIERFDIFIFALDPEFRVSSEQQKSGK